MKAVQLKPVENRADGKQVVQALIVSNTTPATLPTTGATVDGMSAKQVFAPMSVLYVVADVEPKVYIANEAGAFIAQ